MSLVGISMVLGADTEFDAALLPLFLHPESDFDLNRDYALDLGYPMFLKNDIAGIVVQMAIENPSHPNRIRTA